MPSSRGRSNGPVERTSVLDFFAERFPGYLPDPPADDLDELLPLEPDESPAEARRAIRKAR